MTDWLRLGGVALLALLALWLAFRLVALLFAVVTWVVGAAVSLAVLAVVLYLGYLLLKRLLGGSGGSGPRSRSKGRERIYE
ncbi:hypothetical protein [Salinilacihabitans rarus]|uniref:hypothetical protein n=1 Tax=Salinilacihabitans rarus TaxID=2961596 RepID=UPI0020C83ACB|nr:hypothetical protein [Salinilacihabitans rarus]